MSIDVGRWVTDNRELLGAATVASLVAGIPCGILARLAMTMIGAAGGSSMMATVGVFTVPGTLRILITPMIFGIPFAVLIAWLGRRLWRDRPIFVRAVAYALAALVLPGLLLLTDSEFNVPGANSEIGRLAFVPALLVYGLVAGLVSEWWLARGTEETDAPRRAPSA